MYFIFFLSAGKNRKKWHRCYVSVVIPSDAPLRKRFIILSRAKLAFHAGLSGVRLRTCLWSSFHIKNTIHCADSIMSACHSVMSVCYSIVFLSFNYVRLSFNYVFLSFNYYISSCLLDIQLCSILSFNYYFLSLNYPWWFSHLIVTVCHAISYFMNFTELWLVAIQLFNMDSISTDRLYLSPQKHRWLLTDVFAQASLRLSCTKFENGVEGNFRCEWFRRKRRKLSTSINIVEWSGGYSEVIKLSLVNILMNMCNQMVTSEIRE